MRTSKLTDGIDITIEDSQQSIEEQLFCNSKRDEKDKKLESSTITMLFKVTSTSSNNPANFKETNIEQLYIFCIKSKYTKIIKHKKMISITRKLYEIHANLWGLYDSLLLLKKLMLAYS